MKFKEFFFSKIITFCFWSVGILIGLALALTAGINGATVLLTILFLICCLASWLAASFFIERKKILKLENTINNLPDKYLLGEILQEPTDITEKKYYEIMKVISRSAIGEVENEKREKEEYYEFIERWIHEIKTPLTACSLIIDNGGDTRKLKRELKRADNITETILYYARLRTAEKDTVISLISTKVVISEAVQSQTELLTAAKMSVESNGGFEVYTDKKDLCFILKQLLVNSAKYCPGCKIKIESEDNKIIYEDNGIGIPDYELPRVTERGFTGLSGRKSGTGMELYIVKELCKRLEIELKIESELSKFTRITFTFGNLTKT